MSYKNGQTAPKSYEFICTSCPGAKKLHKSLLWYHERPRLLGQRRVLGSPQISQKSIIVHFSGAQHPLKRQKSSLRTTSAHACVVSCGSSPTLRSCIRLIPILFLEPDEQNYGPQEHENVLLERLAALKYPVHILLSHVLVQNQPESFKKLHFVP